MEAVKKNIPALRFPEFSEEWKEQLVEDLFEFKNGLNKEKEFFGKGTPIINYKDVYSLRGLTKKDVRGLVEVDENELERFSCKKGDVFFTRTSETIDEIGYSSVLLEDIKNCVFSGFILRARPKTMKLENLFNKYVFSINPTRKEIISKSSYTTRALTSGTLLNKVRIKYPSKQEQKKIGEFLTAIDFRISHLKKKKELLEQYKKGVMKQIFSQESRFRDDNGDAYPEWKNIQLKEAAIINPPTKYIPNRFVYIDLESVEKGQIQKENVILKDGAPSRAQRVLFENDILYQTVRPYQRNNLLFKKQGDYVASTGYAQLRAKYNPTFLYQYIHTDQFVNEVLTRCTGTSYPAINSTDLGLINILMPSIGEQAKIADFLSTVDATIYSIQKQIGFSQSFKKGILQKMFV